MKSKLSVLCEREEKLIAENEELRTELSRTKKQQNERMSTMQGDVFRLKEELQQVWSISCFNTEEVMIKGRLRGLFNYYYSRYAYRVILTKIRSYIHLCFSLSKLNFKI